MYSIPPPPPLPKHRARQQKSNNKCRNSIIGSIFFVAIALISINVIFNKVTLKKPISEPKEFSQIMVKESKKTELQANFVHLESEYLKKHIRPIHIPKNDDVAESHGPQEVSMDRKVHRIGGTTPGPLRVRNGKNPRPYAVAKDPPQPRQQASTDNNKNNKIYKNNTTKIHPVHPLVAQKRLGAAKNITEEDSVYSSNGSIKKALLLYTIILCSILLTSLVL